MSQSIRIRTFLLVGFSALALSTSGCRVLKSLMEDKKEEPAASASAPVTPPPPVASAVPEPSASAVAAAEPAVTDDQIPSPLDFEDEAFERVTKENYKVRVDDLALEINGK